MKKSDFIKQVERGVYEYLDKVIIEKGLSWSEVISTLKSLGCQVSRTTAYDWKVGNSSSFMNYIGEICEILEISAENISIINNSGNMINDSENSNINITDHSLSEQEKEIIDLYRSLSLRKQTEFVSFLLKLNEQD